MINKVLSITRVRDAKTNKLIKFYAEYQNVFTRKKTKKRISKKEYIRLKNKKIVKW